MSANAPERPMERLNYFNGQRLEAEDFRVAQEYQLRVRRYLNRALYSPGVVKGLECLKHPTDKHKVLVDGGLAFDFLGREIILPEAREVPVVGVPSTQPGVVFGNYLVISYGEERTHPVVDGCTVAIPFAPCSGDLAWGAPTRIRSEPRLEFVGDWPADESGKVMLAQVELGKDCSVVKINQGLRKYAVPAKPPKTRALSLEGEKDIDKANPKVLYFHIDGAYPEAAVLYLRATEFSSLYYTELGRHSHTSQVSIDPATQDFNHTHNIANPTVEPAGEHAHRLFLDGAGTGDGVDRNDKDECGWATGQIEGVPHHTHGLKGLGIEHAGGSQTHTHTLTATMGNAGASDRSTRSGKALSHVRNLRVMYDKTEDITQKILDQLKSRPGESANWDQLGDGSTLHAFAKAEGTRAIDLLRLDLDFGPGEHTLTFKVDEDDVGGQIHYSLYIG